MDGLKTSVGECIQTLGTNVNCTIGAANAGAKGLPAANTDTKGTYIISVDITDGTMMATLGGAAPVSSLIFNGTVSMAPDITNPQSIVWKCTSSLASKYLPSACR